MTVLITGGAGYIGSHTNKLLASRGLDTVLLDDLSQGHVELAKWGELEVGSILDAEFLRSVFERHDIDSVIHFAAVASVSESVADPEAYYINNVGGSLNLLRAMKDAHVRTIVFSSTCATYGEPQHVPMSENHPQLPINPYGRTKLMIEQMLWDYSRAYDFRCIALRYFNAAGADPSGDIGEWHEPEQHLIPLVLDAAMGRRDAVTVMGTDYDTPDGTCIRDYIHVNDLAEAHLLALRAAADGATAAFNLGTGTGNSVREVLRAVESVTGVEVPCVDGPRRAGDPAVLVADNRRARQVLGWKPALSDIETIVRHAWAWHRRLHA